MTFPYLFACLMSRCQVKGVGSAFYFVADNEQIAVVLRPTLSVVFPLPISTSFHATGMDPSGKIVLSITGDPCNVRRAGFLGGGSCLLPSAELTSRKCELHRKGAPLSFLFTNSHTQTHISFIHQYIQLFHSEMCRCELVFIQGFLI